MCDNFRGNEGVMELKTNRMGYVIIEQNLESSYNLRETSEPKCVGERLFKNRVMEEEYSKN